MAGAVAASPGRGRQPPAQQTPIQLQGALLWFAAFILAMSNFMAVLDTSVANVSIPNIAGGLAVSPNQGTWVITS